ncbi:Rrf2 family transcriptional regulator [Holzapfeliella sp. He02]|uniref:Rrf2 family transcriptional regulator n=1 Tax=Holzapfeliella saturejae TaxID=3082953 RepID=A0ABU8SEX2_9LACO
MANTKFSNAVYILVAIATSENEQLSSQKIAAQFNSSACVVRRIMSELKKSQLINSTRGSAKTTISKEPQEITLYQIFKAVTPDYKILNVDEKVDQSCPLTRAVPEVLKTRYEIMQQTMENQLKEQTLQDIIDDIKKTQSQ